MRIIPMIALFACVACAHALALAQDEERAPSRGLLKRGLLAKGKATTTTTTPPPPSQEEAEYEDEEYVVEGEGQEPSTEAPVSSTEGKKLVGSGVRPFRSNTDLLETLKRRRAQAAEAKLHGFVSTAAPAPEAPTEAPVKANFSKKRFNSQGNEDSPAHSSKTRNRFSRPSPKSLPEPDQEEQEEAAPPPAPAAGRTGRTFRLRGGN